MRLSPNPGFVARAADRGFTASFSATVAYDAAAGPLGALKAVNATGPLALPDGDANELAGDSGGLFSVAESAGGISVGFDRGGLGDGFAEGEMRATETRVAVTDGASTISARLRVTVRRPLAAPVLLSAIPDQTDMLS